MPKCSVPNCTDEAVYEVILYDFYPHNGEVFFEQDYTCPFICLQHAKENEEQIRGVRQPRACPRYPYTNMQGAQGFTIYKPFDEERQT